MREGPPPNSDGLNYFTVEVNGEWRGGWFRIRDGILQVYSSGQTRSAPVEGAAVETLNRILRELLMDIVRQSSSAQPNAPVPE